MDFDLPNALPLLLIGLMLAFGFGWLASRFDLRQWKREQQESPKAYFKGLNLLLNEQQDKAIDAFIEAVQHDAGSSDLHFALGNLFRRRGEYERAVRVHQHLLGRGDLAATERERAQHALAQDYLKAGLFDRAEEAFRALEGTAFATDARLERLTLHEHARDWHDASEVARKLEAAGAGSFAQRIAHHHCELAIEADARQRPDEAAAEVAKARAAAPQAARPRVVEAQRLAQAGRHAEALAAWAELLTVQASAFPLVAADVARSGLAAGDTATARALLLKAYERQPALDLVLALLTLEPQPAERLARLRAHLERHPTASAAAALLQERQAQGEAVPGGPAGTGAGTSTGEAAQVVQVLNAAAKPLRRYRCAACGFEAQNYFWQCPGCHSWDSYPPTRLEDQ